MQVMRAAPRAQDSLGGRYGFPPTRTRSRVSNASMKTKTSLAHLALLTLAAAPALAGSGDFRIVVDSPRAARSEDTALHGYVLLNGRAENASAVGTVGRAFSTSRGTNNSVWGVVTEAINFPMAGGNVIGLEAAAANMAHDNRGAIRGLDVVFKNRADVAIGIPVPMVGDNRFNERSVALHVSAQPRSPAGEYSGWQTGLKFANWSLDRSATVPYAVGIDFSEAEVPARFYLMVWRCGAVKCGLKPGAAGLEVEVDIDRLP